MERIRPLGFLPSGIFCDVGFGRLGRRVVDVVEDIGAPQLRRDLCPPQDVVGAGEFLHDSSAEGWLEGGGGGRHAAHLTGDGLARVLGIR